MDYPKLDDRLKGVADFIPPCDTFLDVGTDHAYLPVYLLKKGICKRAIASDLRCGPLKSAEKTASLYGVKENISLRLGSGFETAGKGEVSAAAVCGMGGILISEILKASDEVVREIETLILQPMTAVYELRCYLYENGYTIDDEILREDDGKIYSILKVHSEKCPAPSNAEIFMGKHILQKNGELYTKYKEKQIKKLETKIQGMKKSRNTENRQKLEETEKLLNDIKKLI